MRGDRRRTGLFAHAGACVTDAPDIHSASELPDRQALSVWCDHSVYEWWKEGPAQGRCMVDFGGVDEEHAKEQEKLRERGTGDVARCPYPTLSAYRYLQSVLCAAVPAIIHVSYTMRTGQFCTLHAVLVWHHHRSTHKAIHKVLGGGADTSVGRSAWV